MCLFRTTDRWKCKTSVLGPMGIIFFSLARASRGQVKIGHEGSVVKWMTTSITCLLSHVNSKANSLSTDIDRKRFRSKWCNIWQHHFDQSRLMWELLCPQRTFCVTAGAFHWMPSRLKRLPTGLAANCSLEFTYETGPLLFQVQEFLFNS